MFEIMYTAYFLKSAFSFDEDFFSFLKKIGTIFASLSLLLASFAYNSKNIYEKI